MIMDIFTILRKELMEILYQGEHGRASTVRMLIFIGVFGILLPLQNGIRALTSPVGMIFWLWIPYMLISGITADTFAGERERQTLETLLASRLSDRAILFGKLGAVISYGWGMTLITILVNLVTINLFFWQGRVIFYPPLLLGAALLATLLISVFAAGLGVVISLRSATTRSAQQTMGLLIFIPIIPLVLLTLLPKNLLFGLTSMLAAVNLTQVAIGAIILLFLVDVVLVWFSLNQFQRSKLISD